MGVASDDDTRTHVASNFARPLGRAPEVARPRTVRHIPQAGAKYPDPTKPMRAISIKLPDPLERKLDALAKARGQNRSEVIRDAIEAFAGGLEKPSVLDDIGHLVGCLDDEEPADLATDPEHMKGFGLDNRSPCRSPTRASAGARDDAQGDRHRGWHSPGTTGRSRGHCVGR